MKHLHLSFSVQYTLCTYILCSHRSSYWLNHKRKTGNFLCSLFLIFVILLLYPNISAVLVFVDNDFKNDSKTQWDEFFSPSLKNQNKPSVIPAFHSSVLWETAKPYLRMLLMRFIYRNQKEEKNPCIHSNTL